MNQPFHVRWWNVDQTFVAEQPHEDRERWPHASGASHKAALWDSPDRSISIGGERVSDAAMALAPARVRHARFSLPAPGEEWMRTDAGRRIVAAIESAGACVLAPAVWTLQCERILHDLLKLGLDVTAEVNTTHGRVFYWNTRCGMREFFLATPALADMSVPSLVCYDPAQVAWAATRLATEDLVVKSNFSMGGRGVSRFGPGNPFTIDAIAGSYATAKGAKGPKKGGSKRAVWAWRQEPFVVECFIGDSEANRSITVDGEVRADGSELVGLSEQNLSATFCYTGVRSTSLAAEIQSAITTAALSAGERLRKHGYRGFFNVDFGVTADGAPFVCDLNVRRSAPLDVHMLLRRLSQMRSKKFEHYWSCDAWTVRGASEPQVQAELDAAGVKFDGEGGALLLSRPYPGRRNKHNTVALLVLADDAGRLESLLDALQRSRR